MKVLLCAGSEKNIKIMSALIEEMEGLEVIATAFGAEARNELRSGTDIGMALISTPLADESGVELATIMAEEYALPVMLICGEENYKRLHSKLYELGISMMKRPVEKKALTAMIEGISSTALIAGRLRKETAVLHSQLEEIKLINRAKALLMKNLKMTEAQAHRYIEKHAMDLHQTRKVIAQNVLKTYYNK